MGKHILQKGTVWYFRLNVPADLKGKFGKTVIMKSLETGDKRVASKRAKSLATQWKAKFSEFRDGRKLDPVALEQEPHDMPDKQQAEDKTERVPPSAPSALPGFLSPPGQTPSAISIKGKSLNLEKLQSCLGSNDFSIVRDQVATFMRQNGYNYDAGTLEYNQIARGIIETLIRLDTLTRRRSKGDVPGGDSVRTIAAPSVRKAIMPEIDSIKPHPLSEIVPLYISKHEKRWAVRSTPKFTAELEEFLEISGDIPMDTIDHATIRDFRDILLRLPSHKNKKKIFRSKSIKELLTMDIPEADLLSEKTVDDKIKTVSGFLKWAVGEGYVEMNYAHGIGIKGAKLQHTVYQPYSDSDISNIFNDCRYVADSFQKDWQFWIPILALYSGARQAALAGLHCDDLRQTGNGVWYIHISKDKTKADKRDIPLHDFITRTLNFPAFVAKVKASGRERIFETRFQNNSYGHEVSKWFNGTFITKVDLESPENGRRKTFHSFRGTLINQAKQNGTDIAMIEETLGPADSTGPRQQSMSGGYSADDQAVEARYMAVIKPVRFEIENMAHLRKSKFVVRQS